MTLFEPYTSRFPRWFSIGVLSLWLCGWFAAEVILIATMCGADIPWQGGNTPPLWSLIILTAFWTTAGAVVAGEIVRLVRGRKR